MGLNRTLKLKARTKDLLRDYKGNQNPLKLIRDIMLRARAETILDVVKPGVTGAEVYKVYLDAWNELGYPPVRFIGHGLGLSTHERPLLSDFEKLKLEEKMLLCIEPLLLFPGVEGYQIEDEVLVTKGGHEILTNLMDTSNLYEI